MDDWHPGGGPSDYEAVMEGYVSVTPHDAARQRRLQPEFTWMSDRYGVSRQLNPH